MEDERWLMITPQQVGVGIDEKTRSVRLGLDVSNKETGLAPGLSLGIVMSPTEARRIAGLMLRKADEAEA